MILLYLNDDQCIDHNFNQTNQKIIKIFKRQYTLKFLIILTLII